MRSVRANDLVIAISFTPYGKETQHRLRIAQHHQAKTPIITDSNLSPLAKRANAVLLVNEGSVVCLPLVERHPVPVPGVIYCGGVPVGVEGG